MAIECFHVVCFAFVDEFCGRRIFYIVPKLYTFALRGDYDLIDKVAL